MVGADLDYCDIEWFALETNRDHSVVFEIASKYCISDSFVDHGTHFAGGESAWESPSETGAIFGLATKGVPPVG